MNVFTRVPRQLHKLIKDAAKKRGVSMNVWCQRTFEQALHLERCARELEEALGKRQASAERERAA